MKLSFIEKYLRYLLLLLFLLASVFPLYWIIVTSLKGPKEIYTWPLLYWPSELSLKSYSKLFSFSNFGKYFLNSLIVSLCASFIAMAVSVCAGFALSRYKSPRTKHSLLLALYFTQTIPAFVLMVPLFTALSALKLINNLPILGLIYVATVIAFSTIMAKSFFDRIPSSLEEAAMIDGCSAIQSLAHVILPVTLPGMFALFSFAFINIWNELFLAVMLLSSDKYMTVPVALNSFISKAGISWDVMSSGIVMALLPTMIIFGIGQKYIVAGLVEGSVKG
ncbi:MAG: carbohydrate ABC transporter permease [Spirochaetota bacterium]